MPDVSTPEKGCDPPFALLRRSGPSPPPPPPDPGPRVPMPGSGYLDTDLRGARTAYLGGLPGGGGGVVVGGGGGVGGVGRGVRWSTRKRVL